MSNNNFECFTPKLKHSTKNDCFDIKLLPPKYLSDSCNIFVVISSFYGIEECYNKVCVPTNTTIALCLRDNFFNDFISVSMKKYTGTKPININCLDKQYKYKINISIIDNVGLINKSDWFNQSADDIKSANIYVETIEVDNKSKKIYDLKNIFKLPFDKNEISCPNDNMLSFMDPIGYGKFLNTMASLIKALKELTEITNSKNQEPLAVA